jgi:hypothetical protein
MHFSSHHEAHEDHEGVTRQNACLLTSINPIFVSFVFFVFDVAILDF